MREKRKRTDRQPSEDLVIFLEHRSISVYNDSCEIGLGNVGLLQDKIGHCIYELISSVQP